MKRLLQTFSGIVVLATATAQTPTMVKQINASGNADVKNVVDVNGIVFFSANDGTNGAELWKSDGTSAGTVMVKDINPGSTGSAPANLINVNDTLYFVANDGTNGKELWKSDGTSAGTVMVKDITAGSGSPFGSAPFYAILNNKLYFSANFNQQLWTTDGTAAGTVQVKALTGIGKMLTVNGMIFIGNYDDLWVSDGTTAGTVSVQTGILNGAGGGVWNMTAMNNKCYFFPSPLAGVGHKLYVSDGTTAGTSLVKAVGTTSSGAVIFTAVVNNVLYFNAIGSNGMELWKSDGTSAGTVMVQDINPSGDSNPTNLTALTGGLIFSATDGTNGLELWTSDGTGAGTTMIKDIYSGSTASTPNFFANINNTLFFRANDGTNGTEFWKSDGTSAGTVLISDIIAGGVGSNPRDIVGSGSNVFLSAGDGTVWRELFVMTAPNGISTLEKNSVRLYPSPAANEVAIEVTDFNKTICQVYNGQGALLKNFELVSNKTMLPLDGFTSGIYFVRTTDATGKVSVLKFVKE